MSSSSLPALKRQKRRSPLPSNIQSNPLLEHINQGLYSSVGLATAAAMPQELNFFSYAKGQNVPGAGNASGQPSTMYHTNLDTPNALAQPKVFTCTGVRVFVPNIVFTAAAFTPQVADLTFNAAATSSFNLNDLLLIAFSSTLQVFIGPKTYVWHPAYLCPSNIGMGGLIDLAQDNGTAATIGSQSTTLGHLIGKGYTMETYPLTIASNQSFGAKLTNNWPTNPSIISARLVFVWLDGILSREVL